MADLEEKKVVLTNTEVTKLKNELEDLRLNKRKEISAKIKFCRISQHFSMQLSEQNQQLQRVHI